MSHAGSAQNIPKKTRFRLDKNVADARLESTSPSTDVFITVFASETAVLCQLDIVYLNSLCF